MIWELGFSVVAALLGNAAATLLRAIRASLEARRKLEDVKEVQFAAAINSGSLKVLGSYLEGPIASFKVKEYADNPDVRERVNAFFARLEDFVGARGEARDYIAAPQLASLPPKLNDPELARVESQIEEGHLWDALAGLRRTIEIRLAALAVRYGISVGPGHGAGRLATILHQRGIIPTAVAEDLRYAIHVANRGVHGIEVNAEETVSALAAAARALEQLEIDSPTVRPGNR